MFYRPFCKSTKRTDTLDSSNIRQNKNLQTEAIDLDYSFSIGSFRRFAERPIKHPFLNPFRRCYKRINISWVMKLSSYISSISRLLSNKKRERKMRSSNIFALKRCGCVCEVRPPKNWSARTCACEPRSGRARCVRAKQKTVATQPLDIYDIE